jgi:predicted nucleic acid-binding protein
MGLILDTSVLIDGERGQMDLPTLLQPYATEEVGITAITVAELLLGAERAIQPASRMRRAAYAEWIIQTIPVLPFDVRAARRHAELRALLTAQGTMIGAHDLQIAATAVAGGHAVVTRDVADFRRVPGLQVIDPVTAD